MKIKQLDVAGFRSLKSVSWQPGDLNVVIGQNGTGKSNLLRILELFSVFTKQGRLSKHIREAGGMGAILWDGIASSIHIRVETTQPDYEYELELVRFGQSSSYRIEREALSSDAVLSQSQPAPVNAGLAPIYSSRFTHEHLTRINGQLSYGKQPIDSDAISQEETLLSYPALPSVFTASALTFRNQLNPIAVYHDLDVGPKSMVRQAVVARNEKIVESDGQNLVPVLHTLYTGDREFKRNVDLAMSAAFGSVYEELVFPPDAGDQRVQMRVRWRSLKRDQSTADLSDGTLRYLLLIAILSVPDPPMLIAIDEPETGLHPSMLPIIAEYAIEASSRTQVVFTTHSPQFLDAFTDTRPTTTVAMWENGETSLHTLQGKTLDYWLTEYSLGSLFTSGELEALA